METRINREGSHAFIAHPTELRALATQISTSYPTVVYSATCHDGSRLKTSDFEEILNFENPSFRRIESISFDFTKNQKDVGTLEISATSGTPYELTIFTTDDPAGIRLAQEIQNRMAEMRPWYSALTSPNFPSLVAIIVLLACSIVGLVAKAKGVKVEVSATDVLFMAFPALVVGSLMLNYGVRAWGWLFPKGLFAIGRQTAVIEKRLGLQKCIFGTAIGGIILSIIANLLTPQW